MKKFVTNFKILPPRTPGLGICLRHEAIRLVIARSEATWQSCMQAVTISPMASHDSAGYCEIAASACGLLAMTNLGALRKQ